MRGFLLITNKDSNKSCFNIPCRYEYIVLELINTVKGNKIHEQPHQFIIRSPKSLVKGD